MELIFIIGLLITNAITLAFLVPNKVNHNKQVKSLHKFYEECAKADEIIYETKLGIKNKQIQLLENNLTILRGKKFTK